ncbi:MAG TPA: hypothetical protein VGN15_01270 [Ktedonobacteraceae bacterium]|nr:hypothetical protein [Ktedonobacteraceae bacterium]
MAKALDGIESLSGAPSLARSLRAVGLLRLVLGSIILLGSILFLLGTSWDIQWHTYIGRDRTLIPPHIMMLTGVALSGVAALVSVFIESIWARRNTTIAQNSVSFAELFRGSTGAYIAGFGALDAAIAFPLDSYWHALYGIDVAIWAPFHIMFVVGMAIVALGAAYMLESVAHLAESANARGVRRIGYVGVLLAFATMLGLFTLLLFDAMHGRGFIDFGLFGINLFPLLAALLYVWTFLAVVYAVPWRWAALGTAAFYLLFAIIIALFVPPATDALVTAEHLFYRDGQPGMAAAVALEWPLSPFFVALAVDLLTRKFRKVGWSWSRGRSAGTLLLLTSITFLAIPVFFPIYAVYLVSYLGAVGSVVTLLLGLLGASIGFWFGRNMGESLRSLESEESVYA